MPEINNLSGKIFILVYDSHRVSANGCLTLLLCARGKAPHLPDNVWQQSHSRIMTARKQSQQVPTALW